VASKLSGLFKTLAWTDFGGTPDPKKPALDAFTSSKFDFPVRQNFVKTPGSSVFRFDDSLTIAITMSSTLSWRRTSSIQSKGSAYSTDLLKHEQGHYDITALIARDLFIEVMQLKAKSYPSGAAGDNDLKPILNKFAGKAEKISKIYDSTAETNHGANTTAQARWNKMIERAFTEPRAGGGSAPDGATYKIPFLDALSQNGIKP
jgi:hypothetical protein